MLHLWSAKLETGLPKIDEQHKELFRQVGVLMDRTKAKADRIPETVNFLGDYVLMHFNDEQGLHASVQYPKAAAHKKQHIAFIAKFSELKKKLGDSGDNLQFEVMTEINSTAIGWLKDHIMVHDKEFADYYKQRQARLPRGGPSAPRAAPKAAPRLWRPELETGIPKLDERFQEMFRQAEILLDKDKAGLAGETISSLGEYMAKHFRAEERVQAGLGYPAAQAHQRSHNDFIRKYKNINLKLTAANPGDRQKMTTDIGRGLTTWLKGHIITQDQDFAAYYKKNRQGGQKGRGFLYRLFQFLTRRQD